MTLHVDRIARKRHHARTAVIKCTCNICNSQHWSGNSNLDQELWGSHRVGNHLKPNICNLLLRHCFRSSGVTANCDTRRCTCQKHGVVLVIPMADEGYILKCGRPFQWTHKSDKTRNLTMNVCCRFSLIS